MIDENWHADRAADPAAYFNAQFSKDLALFRLGARLLGGPTEDVAASIAALPPAAALECLTALQHAARMVNHVGAKLRPTDLDDELEKQRAPLPEEPHIILPERILVLAKRSKVEFDQIASGLSLEQLRKKYMDEGADAERIFASHESHCAARRELQSLVGTANWHAFWDLSEEQRKALIESADYDAILAFGGDDTAKAIAPYVTDKFFVLFNSDEHNSQGALAACTRCGYRGTIAGFSQGAFVIEEWTRLATEITIPQAGGPSIITTRPAINEIAIIDQLGKYPMRGAVEFGTTGARILIKGSGVLIATGAGSTGWFSSASSHIYPFGRRFPRTARRAELIQREPYRYGQNPADAEDVATAPWNSAEVLSEGEVITVHSSSNRNPILTVDCTVDYPFPRGAAARISLAESGLKFLRAASDCFPDE